MKSIRLRLIVVFSAVILIAMLGLGLISINMFSNRLTQDAYEDMQALAEAEAKYIQTVREGELRYLTTLANNPLLLNEEISWLERTAYLEKEAEQNLYQAFVLVDRTGLGRELNSSGRSFSVANESYFQEALKGNTVITDIIINPDTKGAETVFAVPVERNGRVEAVLYGVRDGLLLSDIVNETKYGQTGYAYILNTQGTAMAHGDRNRVLTKDNAIQNSKSNPALKNLADLMETRMLRGEIGYDKYVYEGVERLVGFAPIGASSWILITAVESAEVMQAVAAPRNILIAILIGAMLLAGLATFVMSNSMAKPIASIIPVMEKLTRLDLSFDDTMEAVQYIKRRDEIGQVIKAVADVEKDISAAISEIQEIAETVALTSENLSAAAQENSATIEEVASSTGAFSQNVDHTAQRAEALAIDAGAINELAEQGRQQMEASMTAMQRIESGSDQVQSALLDLAKQTQNMEEVLKLISDIADQTNLLALNAAIEAARAGEHGRGFAVVADEVRNLAEQTQRSIEEITQMITGLVQNANRSTQVMSETNTQVEDGTKLLNQTQQGLAEITNRVAEISGRIAEMNQDILEMQDGSGNIAAATEEQAASMEEIASTTGNLAQVGDNLRTIVGRFKIQ